MCCTDGIRAVEACGTHSARFEVCVCSRRTHLQSKEKVQNFVSLCVSLQAAASSFINKLNKSVIRAQVTQVLDISAQVLKLRAATTDLLMNRLVVLFIKC